MGISVFEDVKVRRAASYAEKKHKGQKYGGGDYFKEHVEKVANSTYCAGGGSIELQVAYLHDVVEDTETTLEEIRMVFGEEVVEAVDAITKREGESREDYLKRCHLNEIARKVKFSDAWCNFEKSMLDGDNKRVNRYRDVMYYMKPEGI